MKNVAMAIAARPWAFFLQFPALNAGIYGDSTENNRDVWGASVL